jgi:hypothetical protein
VFLFLLSVALFGGSFGLWALSRRQSIKAMAAGQTPEYPVSQLVEEAAAVAAQLGAGAFRQPVKVHGTIECDSPLSAELTQTPCVAYNFSVTREYEEVSWSADDKGNQTSNRQRKSEVVSSNTRSVPFWLQTPAGRIRVIPDKAKLDLVPSHSSFELAHSQRFGRFHLELPRQGDETLGYRYEESCLAVDREVSVFAEATDVGGSLELRRPESNQALFVISPRSFQELAQGVRTSAYVLFGSSIGVAVLAAVVLLLGVLR